MQKRQLGLAEYSIASKLGTPERAPLRQQSRGVHEKVCSFSPLRAS